MALTATDIDHLANLALLALDADERAVLTARLNDCEAILEALADPALQGLQPQLHSPALGPQPRLHLAADEASEPDRRSANQQSAPAVEDGLFLVPRVLE